MRYAVVIERSEGNFCAYVPDLPGCIATGLTIPDVEAEIRDAIEFHLDGMLEDGLPFPPPSSRVEYIELGGMTPAHAVKAAQRAALIAPYAGCCQ